MAVLPSGFSFCGVAHMVDGLVKAVPCVLNGLADTNTCEAAIAGGFWFRQRPGS